MAYTDAMSSVAVLSRLYYPDIPLVLPTALVLLKLRVIIEEELVLRVFDSLDDMEGERQCIEDIHLHLAVVCTHIVEKCFLVAYVVVLLEVVMHHHFGIVFYALQGLRA